MGKMEKSFCRAALQSGGAYCCIESSFQPSIGDRGGEGGGTSG